jgi:hypothetical protein
MKGGPGVFQAFFVLEVTLLQTKFDRILYLGSIKCKKFLMT